MSRDQETKRTFLRITNRDVWNKIADLDVKISRSTEEQIKTNADVHTKIVELDLKISRSIDVQSEVNNTIKKGISQLDSSFAEESANRKSIENFIKEKTTISKFHDSKTRWLAASGLAVALFVASVMIAKAVF